MLNYNPNRMKDSDIISEWRQGMNIQALKQKVFKDFKRTARRDEKITKVDVDIYVEKLILEYQIVTGMRVYKNSGKGE